MMSLISKMTSQQVMDAITTQGKQEMTYCIEKQQVITRNQSKFIRVDNVASLYLQRVFRLTERKPILMFTNVNVKCKHNNQVTNTSILRGRYRSHFT